MYLSFVENMANEKNELSDGVLLFTKKNVFHN